MGAANKQVLVVGGGVAGMAAARTLDQYGFKVHLVEKDDHLGGHAVKWACMATGECRNCGACLSVELVDRMQYCMNTQVYLNTSIESLKPMGEGYRAVLKGGDRTDLEVDALVLATGMRPFDASQLESLQYGHHPRVITTVDLNRLLQTGTLNDLLGQEQAPSVAFIQCVGSRNKRLGNDYCSQVCCKVALRQAGKLRQLFPESNLSIFHIDLQLIGKEIRTQARELANDVSLLQGVAGEVRIDEQTGKLVIIREEASSGERQAHHFDLVVLAVGMRPADNLEELLKPLGVPFDNWGFLSSQNALPARMQVAGAGRFPTDISGSMLQGVNAAHHIAADLAESAGKKMSGTVAVFGNGAEGRRVAGAVQDAGYSALLLEEQAVSGNDAPAYELIAPAQVTGLGGNAGNFTLRYVQEGEAVQRQVMALVVANGIERRSPAPSLPVASLPEIERTMATDGGSIPSRVVFLLDRHGPEDKTNFRRALECAVDLSGSGREVTIVMERVLVHTADGQQLYDRARGQGVRFLRAVDAGAVRITRVDNGLELTMQDSTLGGLELALGCDLVVAAEEILPAPQTASIAGLIGESLDREGFAQAANVRLRPINSRKKGIFYAGRCHEEDDDGDLDKEIRNLICQLALMDQRAPGADETALIDERLCGRCLTCFRTCPHGAVAIVRDCQPQIQPDVCLGCGRCVSQCPARAISLGPTPLDTGKEGQTVVYACRRSGSLAANQALDSGLIAPDESMAIIQVPCCRSRVGIQELLDAMQAGARRVIVAACHQGNCQSVDAGGTPDEHLRHRAGSIGFTDAEISWHTLAANEPVRLQQILVPAAPDTREAQ